MAKSHFRLKPETRIPSRDQSEQSFFLSCGWWNRSVLNCRPNRREKKEESKMNEKEKLNKPSFCTHDLRANSYLFNSFNCCTNFPSFHCQNCRENSFRFPSKSSSSFFHFFRFVSTTFSCRTLFLRLFCSAYHHIWRLSTKYEDVRMETGISNKRTSEKKTNERTTDSSTFKCIKWSQLLAKFLLNFYTFCPVYLRFHVVFVSTTIKNGLTFVLLMIRSKRKN